MNACYGRTFYSRTCTAKAGYSLVSTRWPKRRTNSVKVRIHTISPDSRRARPAGEAKGTSPRGEATGAGPHSACGLSAEQISSASMSSCILSNLAWHRGALELGSWSCAKRDRGSAAQRPDRAIDPRAGRLRCSAITRLRLATGTSPGGAAVPEGPLSCSQRRRRRGDLLGLGDSGVHALSAGAAERAGFESMGRDLQRGGSRACADQRKADRTSVHSVARGADVRHAARRRRGVDRPRGATLAPSMHLSRTHGRQPRRFSQPRGSVP